MVVLRTYKAGHLIHVAGLVSEVYGVPLTRVSVQTFQQDLWSTEGKNIHELKHIQQHSNNILSKFRIHAQLTQTNKATMNKNNKKHREHIYVKQKSHLATTEAGIPPTPFCPFFKSTAPTPVILLNNP